jgi:hypothetical protein
VRLGEPVWSRDGKAFDAVEGSRASVVLTYLDGANTRYWEFPIAPAGAIGSWSPTAPRFAYVRDQHDLAAVSADTGSGYVVNPSLDAGGWTDNPLWVDSGRAVAYRVARANNTAPDRLFWTDVSGASTPGVTTSIAPSGRDFEFVGAKWLGATDADLYFLADLSGIRRLYRATVAGSAGPAELVSTPRDTAVSVAVFDQPHTNILYMAVGSAAALYRLSTAAGATPVPVAAPITAFNRYCFGPHGTLITVPGVEKTPRGWARWYATTADAVGVELGSKLGSDAPITDVYPRDQIRCGDEY